ncbi:MAG: GyrI-like domain-containing protein [Coriobacteriales bacterium]|jgi:hypothetical protein|nr:GyrI-like domain-containing protein [Coriobacteriales bacterium]
METKSEFSIYIKELADPVYVVGRKVRVKHGTPECFVKIDNLIEGFFAEDVPSQIPEVKLPLVRFGICSHHVYYSDIIEFDYLTGVEVVGPIDRSRLPATTTGFVIPSGTYACIKVSAIDSSTALDVAYSKLDEWLSESEEWEAFSGEYEMYPDELTNAVMELWRPIEQQ